MCRVTTLATRGLLRPLVAGPVPTAVVQAPLGVFTANSSRSQRWCSTTGSSSSSHSKVNAASSEPSTTNGNADATAAPQQQEKGFQTSVRFKLAPGQVNETNAPSVRELSRVLPSARELHAQLPNARELERTYINAEVAAKTVSDKATKESIFVETTDSLEDLTDAAEMGEAPVTATHLLLAYRALAWGTVYAVAGFVIVVALSMWACGYHSVAELMAGVPDKVKRDEAKLHETTERNAWQSGGAVVHYDIDLSNPTAAFQQMREIWQSLQVLAENKEETEK